MKKRAVFTTLFAMILMFLGWWAGIDYLQRSFIPAYYTFCVLTLSAVLYIVSRTKW